MAGVWTNPLSAPRSRRAVQALTETATDGTEGVSLENVGNVVVILRAPTGQTFDGTGRMVGYVWDGSAWLPQSDADIDMAEAAGKATWIRSLTISSPRGLFQYLPTGIGVSGGTQITTDYRCTGLLHGDIL